MSERFYEISIGMDVVAKEIPERYLMSVVNGLFRELNSEKNLSILIVRSEAESDDT